MSLQPVDLLNKCRRSIHVFRAQLRNWGDCIDEWAVGAIFAEKLVVDKVV